MADPGSDLFVGTSGFSYDDWKGVLYPDGLPRNRWLEHYAARFRALEANVSFYRLPNAKLVQSWVRRAPPGFRIAFKMHRAATHFRRLVCPGAAASAQSLLERIEPLGAHLGPVLLQVPPNLHRDLSRLDTFLNELPSDFRYALEVRHPSWWEDPDRLRDTLARHRVAWVRAHSTTLETPPLNPTDFTYYRFHGTAGFAYGQYRDALRPFAEEMAGDLARGRTVWAFFNNTMGGDGVADAQRLRAWLEPDRG